MKNEKLSHSQKKGFWPCWGTINQRFQFFVFEQKLVSCNTSPKPHLCKKSWSWVFFLACRTLFMIYFRKCYIEKSWENSIKFVKFQPRLSHRGAALGTAGTAVAVPEFPIIQSLFRETFHFVSKPTNLVGFWRLCFPNIKSRSIQFTCWHFSRLFPMKYDDVEYFVVTPAWNIIQK